MTTLKAFDLTREMLDHSFAETVAPDREKLLTCIQCGTCTASCPTAYAMDYTPRQLWRLVQLGLREEVLNSRTFWLCTSCYSCTIRCPRGISLTETMSTLKRLALAEGVPGREKNFRFYKTFIDTVRHRGRLHEVEFITRYLGRYPVELSRQALASLNLFRRGKVALMPDSSTRRFSLEPIFQKVEEMEGHKL